MYKHRQGEEWYRHRVVLSKKLLRPKEVTEFCGDMSLVADDFIKRMAKVQLPDHSIHKFEYEVFKWALECKLLCVQMLLVTVAEQRLKKCL